MSVLNFQPSANLSLGIELELQLVDLSDFDLAAGASDLLSLLEKRDIAAVVTPELTESMLEISCGIFQDWREVREQLRVVRDQLVSAADLLNLGICGGGTHPFQRWQKRKIFSTDRFMKVSELYGYLAKQFTVFGQHIHVGCPDGDTGLRLLHALNAYVPHFIALSASSPFFQGADTQFESARLNSIAAFPLSGRAPFYLEWDRFCDAYFVPMQDTGIVKSMKDFYWDIRPKPEYGTIELRVCDTPLDVDQAALLVGYFQLLCRWLQAQSQPPEESDYMVYTYNRFQACRFGWDANYVDPRTHQSMTLRNSFLRTLEDITRSLGPNADDSGCISELTQAGKAPSDASTLKKIYRSNGTFEDVVQYALLRFRDPECENALRAKQGSRIKQHVRLK